MNRVRPTRCSTTPILTDHDAVAMRRAVISRCTARAPRCQDLKMAYETGRATTANPSNVKSRDTFADFLEVALGDLRLGGGESEWENGTLDRFLDALARFAEARVVGREDQEQPTWGLFAEMIHAATGYE